VEKVRSKDHTAIAFDRLGDGSAVIVVGGATCDRTMTRPLAEKLGQHFTVMAEFFADVNGARHRT